ncbi:hypothetical protein FPOA_00869 [Fusarium poae]|uniref:Uncharacterized protein n=1 Tax=Fusarium poae TaxID=36050 RepID=A0A1B8B2J3_FUSPO|nr:hypothetical protein FPOA_00869 [Fusarium poae]
MSGHSRDFAFNTANIAYDTGKPNRAEFQRIRIERIIGDQKTGTANDQHPCCLVEQQVRSSRALNLDSFPIGNIALVVGEYLPEKPPKFHRRQLPTHTEVFNHRIHRYLQTRDKTAPVVRMISYDRGIFYRLLKCNNGHWIAGALSGDIHEHIYFYREFTDGVKEEQKASRLTKYKANIEKKSLELIEVVYRRNHNDGSNEMNDTNRSNDENDTNGSDNENNADSIPISRAEPDSPLAQAADDVFTLLSAANRSVHNHPVPQNITDVFGKLFSGYIIDEEGAKSVAEHCVTLWKHDCPVPAIRALAQSIRKGALGQINEEAYLARTLIYNFCTLYEMIGSIADHDALAQKAYLLATKTVDKPYIHNAMKQEGIEILDTMLRIQRLQFKAIDETREADRAQIPNISKLLDDTVSAMDYPSAVESAKKLLVLQGAKHDRTMEKVADMIEKEHEGLKVLRETLD